MIQWFANILLLLMLSPLSFAQDQGTTHFFKDAKNYAAFIQQAKEVKLQDQVEVWKNFLEQYPNSYFRSEIEHNIEELEKVLGVRHLASKEVVDTEIFFKAKRYIERNQLSKRDQIALWNQFLSEHPDNQHNDEIKGMISELGFALQKNKRKKP